ncbi:MAG: hypothetical protein R3E02_05505 [Blastomonas sp.]
MSAALLLLAAVQAEPAYAIQPGSISYGSPEELTESAFEMDCRVFDRRKKSYNVSLRSSGGRAFYQNPDFPETSFVRVTEQFLHVVRDKSRIFESFRKSKKFSFGRTQFAGRYDHGFEVMFEPSDRFDMITIYRHHEDNYFDAPEKVYTGFCKVREIPQKPFSRKETDEILKACPEGRCP